MGKVKLDFGATIDILNHGELREALNEDRALRRVLTGVKSAEYFAPTSVIGAATTFFTTPAAMVGAGLMWAVMNVGAELSTAQTFRLYKGIPPGPAGGVPVTGTGMARAAGTSASGQVPNLTFSKGQLTLRAGEQLTLIAAGAANVLSVFITAISVPAERFGELLI